MQSISNPLLSERVRVATVLVKYMFSQSAAAISQTIACYLLLALLLFVAS